MRLSRRRRCMTTRRGCGRSSWGPRCSGRSTPRNAAWKTTLGRFDLPYELVVDPSGSFAPVYHGHAREGGREGVCCDGAISGGRASPSRLPSRPEGEGEGRCGGRGYCDSLIRMRRYSIVPRSASRPIGPVAGSLRAASRTSPLQVQWATPSLTTTTISFQSWGLYFLSALYGPATR